MRRPSNFGAPAMLVALTALVGLAGCNMYAGHVIPTGGNAPAVRDAVAIETALKRTDAVVQKQIVPTITAAGYGTISVQPASNVNQKRLLAIRAARLDAMRDLMEQVHGLRLTSRTTVIDAVIQNDTTRASVDGVIRGARTVRINPVGKDTYEVVLELDRDMIARIMKAAR